MRKLFYGDILLIGKLASHARGRALTTSLHAVPAGEQPGGNGVCLAFANEFQEGSDGLKKQMIEWTLQPGRTLLLLPPMKIDDCKFPVAWRVINAGTIDSSKNKGLSKLLSAEIKYELISDLQPAKLIDGEWSRGGVNTAYYKKHPNSGVFAVTTLPLWSLTTLDHTQQLIDWIVELHELAGEPIEQEELVEQSDHLTLTPDHYALMLHLVSGNWKSRRVALSSLHDSEVLVLPDERATQCMEELEKYSIADDGKLTNDGKLALSASPFAAYATTLECEHD
ncbi:MAG: hypothetical protein IT422_22905 [Pirellulaceae bacterium]|jgi:hypothetical protein|nr:hypothetical protein [Pirellulaceae bacterium]